MVIGILVHKSEDCERIIGLNAHNLTYNTRYKNLVKPELFDGWENIVRLFKNKVVFCGNCYRTE